MKIIMKIIIIINVGQKTEKLNESKKCKDAATQFRPEIHRYSGRVYDYTGNERRKVKTDHMQQFRNINYEHQKVNENPQNNYNSKPERKRFHSNLQK